MRPTIKDISFNLFLFLGVIGIIIGNACTPIHDPMNLSSLAPAGMKLSVDPKLHGDALGILAQKCAGCHGSSGGVSNITNLDHLVAVGLVIPGDVTNSKLLGPYQGSMVPLAPQGNDLTTLQNWIASMAWVPANSGGTGNTLPPPPTIVVEPTFASLHKLVLTPKCIPCHKTGNAKGKVNYETYDLTIQTGKVTPGDPKNSKMYTTCEKGTMPEAPYSPLDPNELKALYDWIKGGALNN